MALHATSARESVFRSQTSRLTSQSPQNQQTYMSRSAITKDNTLLFNHVHLGSTEFSSLANFQLSLLRFVILKVRTSRLYDYTVREVRLKVRIRAEITMSSDHGWDKGCTNRALNLGLAFRL